mmetsp:Transcript_29180/g.28238  ORF Transcript_29180/g.28238 Transcript_29180/m.28238 type:complete len:122 (-) Transcript_29180:816-1181(-)
MVDTCINSVMTPTELNEGDDVYYLYDSTLRLTFDRFIVTDELGATDICTDIDYELIFLNDADLAQEVFSLNPESRTISITSDNTTFIGKYSVEVKGTQNYYQQSASFTFDLTICGPVLPVI